METPKKPIDVIKDLTQINMELFSVADKLKGYDIDFGLAFQNIRDAAMNIAKGMSKLVEEMPKDKNSKGIK